MAILQFKVIFRTNEVKLIRDSDGYSPRMVTLR